MIPAEAERILRFAFKLIEGGQVEVRRILTLTGGIDSMNSKYQRRITAITLFVVVAVLQTYVGVSFAARTPGSAALSTEAQGLTGILTTTGNKPITVNGVSAATGATILSGATIETPDQVGATINIPGHGSLEIAPNTKVTVEFDQNGNIKVTVIQGCLVLLTKKGTSGEINNAQGVAGKTDGAGDGRLEVCPTKVAGAAAEGGGGLGPGGTVAIVAGIGAGVTALAFGLRGSDPSSGSPGF